MALITQQFPNFLGGYNQQPDYQKPPGSLNEYKNFYPDFTYGATKRPGNQFVSSLNITSPENYYWFAYERTASETYVVAVGNGVLRVFNAFTGVEVSVTTTGTASYLALADATTAWKSFKHVITEKGVIILNTEQTVALSSNSISGTLTGTVTTMGELSSLTPSVGDIYFVTNTGEVNDDLYVIYTTDGAWEETAKPGEVNGMSIPTLPHVLQWTGSAFGLFPIGYSDRLVGAIATNPHPSFVGNTITNIFVYLNRIGFLSGANVVLSQPISPDNTSFVNANTVSFYNQSTLVQSDADPIDISAASVRNIVLRAVLPARQGLVLFAATEQLLLYSDSGIVTPGTATIRSLSTFDTNPDIEPVEIDNEFYFVGGTPPYTRYSSLIKMITRGLEEDPLLTDVSKDVADWIPARLTQFFSSSQEQIVGMFEAGEKIVYFFRRFKRDGELVMQNWFKWEFPFDVIACTVASSDLFTIGKNGSDTFLTFSKLNASPLTDPVEGGTLISGVSLPVKPHLDLYTVASVANDGVTITPSDPNWVTNLTAPVYAIITTNPLNNSAPISSTVFETIGSGFSILLTNNNDGTFTASEDLSGYSNSLIMGYAFEMNAVLPTLYFKTQAYNDYTASLIISRIKVATSIAGAISFQIKQLGSPQWTTIQEVTDADTFYRSDEVAIAQDKTFTLPIHRKNDQFILSIQSTSPYPVTLVSMMWEGQYSPRSYSRS